MVAKEIKRRGTKKHERRQDQSGNEKSDAGYVVNEQDRRSINAHYPD